MKQYLFKFLFLLLPACIPFVAFGSETDSVSTAPQRRWDKRVHRHYEGWERLCPTHAKLQYAGGMGVLSVGVGWDYGKRRQWETDILVGYLPKKYARNLKTIFTLKQNYIPWSMSFNGHWALEPFYCGLYVTTITGKEFWTKEPGRYPDSYYGFSTGIRSYIFIGQRMNFNFRNGLVKHVALFYEVGSCDLYIVSKFTNSSMKMSDILRFSFGAKVQLFKE